MIRLFTIFLLLLTFIFPCNGTSETRKKYRQSAYINNAYFSDKMSQDGKNAYPLNVVKTLQNRAAGVVGYFVLDLVLTSSGTHQFTVDILDQNGKKSTELLYPPVKVENKDEMPLYTAAGAISGNLEPGMWFFKVRDQVNSNQAEMLGTFGILISVAGVE